MTAATTSHSAVLHQLRVRGRSSRAGWTTEASCTAVGRRVGAPYRILADRPAYSPPIEVLFVCTANQSRSPIAAALLRQRLAARGIDGVDVASAGLLPGGAPATRDAQAAVRGLDGHVSRRLTTALVRRADLVVGLCREHVREVVALAPGTIPRAFTLKEVVRRGSEVGPRRPGEPLDGWLERVGAGRPQADLHDEAGPEDDVADPTGCRPEVWDRTVAEIDALVGRLTDLAWPDGGGRGRNPAPSEG